MDRTRKPSTHSIVNDAALPQEQKQLLGGLIREGRLNAEQAKVLAAMGNNGERGQRAAAIALQRIDKGRDVQGLFGQTSRPVTRAEFRQYMNSAITDTNALKSPLPTLGRYQDGALKQPPRKVPRATAGLHANLDLRAR